MRRIIVPIIVLIVFGNNAIGQQRKTGLGVIKGNVADSFSKEVIEYANVAIYSAKSDSLKYGNVTDQNGNFICEGIKVGSYILKVSFMGYKTYVSSVLKISQRQTNIVLENIRMIPVSKELNTVVIESMKKPFEQTFDKKIYLMDENRAAGAETVLDLLKTLPSVTVDPDGNVLFRGQTPNILVDNQPYDLLYPKLEMIPAANVDKIEFIDPSARYQSSSGTINIKLKKPKENGLSGALYSSLATEDFKSLEKYSFGLNINYLYKKVIIFVNGYYGGRINANYTSKNNETLNDSGTLYKSNSINTENESPAWGSANAGIIYNLNKTSKLTATWTPSIFNYKSSTNSNYYESSGGLTREQYYGIGNDDYHSFSNSFSLNYKNSPEDDSKEFTIKASYSNRPNTDISQGVNYFNYYNFYFFPKDSVADIRNNLDQKSDVFSLEIHRRKNIDSTGRWEVGLQGEFYHFSNIKDYLFDTLRIPDYSYNMDNKFFKTTMYGNLGKKIKKFKIDLGLRVSVMGGNMKDLVYPHGIDSLININKIYLFILPNITLGYEIKHSHELKITYSSDLQPPNLDDLNPYVIRSDPRNWVSGNSDLKPIQFNRFTFGYMYTPKFYSISLDAFSNFSNNYLESVSEPLNNYTTLTKPYNIGKTTQNGISLSGNGIFAKWFNANLSVSVFYSTVNASALTGVLSNAPISTEGLKTSSWSANGQFYMNITIMKKYTVSTQFYYGGQEASLGGYSQFGFYNRLYVSRKFLKNQLNITLGVTELIQPSVGYSSNQEYLGKTTYSEYSGPWNKRSFNIAIRYNFNKGDRGLLNNVDDKMPGKK